MSLMSLDPNGGYSSLQGDYIYSYGRISGQAREQYEIMHHMQAKTMRYKLSFTTFKMRRLWSVFDFLAAYFYFVLYISVLSFALYYQLALFWAVALLIYMISWCLNSRAHHNYRQKGRQIFIDKLDEQENGQAMDRLLETENQIITNRRTVFL